MAQVTVGTEAVSLGSVGAGVLVQNLGPGVVYVGPGLVTVDDGVQVSVGQAITLVGGGSLRAVSSSSSDVRYVAGGTGIHSVAAAAE